MKFESVTGESVIYIEQDFRVQILAHNMMQDIRKETNEEVFRNSNKKGGKYPMHTNENIAKRWRQMKSVSFYAAKRNGRTYFTSKEAGE